VDTALTYQERMGEGEVGPTAPTRPKEPVPDPNTRRINKTLLYQYCKRTISRYFLAKTIQSNSIRFNSIQSDPIQSNPIGTGNPRGNLQAPSPARVRPCNRHSGGNPAFRGPQTNRPGRKRCHLRKRRGQPFSRDNVPPLYPERHLAHGH